MDTIRIDDVNVPTDTGCEKARARGWFGKCLQCPFEECLQDSDDRMRRSEEETEALKEKIRTLRKQGYKYKQLQRELHVGNALIGEALRELH